MKLAATLLSGAVLLSACASGPAPLVEQGYQRGALGVAAIDRGDWSRAEQLLTADRNLSKTDPARLLNLGQVYMATDRPEEALSAWRQALAAERHFEVETRDGRIVTTEQLARQALARYDGMGGPER